jgi:hypothetical protein
MSVDLINEFGEAQTVTRYGGSVQDVVLTFDADFVTGNQIDLDIDLTAISTVPFNATHAQTMLDLADEIALNSKVASSTVTGPREITVTAIDEGSDLLINGILVTGGASQAGSTVGQSGGYVDGIYQEGSQSNFTITISIQPLQGRELELLPQGERTRRYCKGYTVTRLYTANESASTKADRVTYDGSLFEVQKSERWVDGDLWHYKVYLAEVNDG